MGKMGKKTETFKATLSLIYIPSRYIMNCMVNTDLMPFQRIKKKIHMIGAPFINSGNVLNVPGTPTKLQRLQKIGYY